MIALAIIATIWDLYWKIKALWLAAKLNQKKIFIALLIINSLRILPIYYLYKNNYFKN